MVKKRLVPMADKDELEFTDNTITSLDAIRLWVPVLYENAPWWLWDAIMGEDGETVNTLREEMARYEAIYDLL